MTAPAPSSVELRIANWLCAALTLLPLLQILPIDFDRSGALFLLAPALWTGRAQLTRALSNAFAGSRVATGAAVVLGLVIVVAVVGAAQPAPAAATAAEWILLAAAAMVAGEVIRSTAAAGRRILTGYVAGSTIAMLLTWAWWVAAGRGEVPLYAHYRHVGLHLLPCAVASTGLLVLAETRRQRIVAAMGGSATWAGLLWSGGRAPVLGLVTAMALVTWLCRRDRKRLVGIIALQLGAGLALSLLFWSPRPELGWWHAVGRTAAAASAGSASELTSTRTEFWRATAARALQRPLFGEGPDAYRFTTPKLDGQQPHNLVLQLWLDVGVIGAVAALVLLGIALTRGLQAAQRTGAVEPSIWLGIAVASVVCGLLDGVFYHLVAFLPAVLSLGVTFAARASAGVTAGSRRRTLLAPALTSAAAAVLMFHTALFYALALATPPAPESFVARITRRFPTTTFGLWRWLDAWQPHDPATSLEWARWAETHSANPPYFHVYAARLLAARGDFAGAKAELSAARATAHWSARPSIDAMIQALEHR